MKRDLSDYQEQYVSMPYEDRQAGFRKLKITEILNKNCHKKLLEIGCGLESIFLFVDSYASLTVVEPGEIFYKKALEDIGEAKNKNIKIIKSFIEDVAGVMASEE